MGMKTRASFEEALEDAKKYVGSNRNILAIPKVFIQLQCIFAWKLMKS